MTRNGDWIQTYTGQQYWPTDPRSEDVHIEDIAHSLSLLCRYNGHCREFYSVAEHSVLVADAVALDGGDRQEELAGLLHDAAEAYLSDVPRPTKPYLVGYTDLEVCNDSAIAIAFGLYTLWTPRIGEMDHRILINEQQANMAMTRLEWAHHPGGEILGIVIHLWTPMEAERQFLSRYHRLADVPA